MRSGPRRVLDVAGEIVRWIDRGRFNDGASLARSLWAGEDVIAA